MDLDDTPLKVNGPKNAVWKLMDLDDTPPKVNGPKNAVWKLMDLDNTPPKVNGPMVHLTQFLITLHWWFMLLNHLWKSIFRCGCFTYKRTSSVNRFTRADLKKTSVEFAIFTVVKKGLEPLVVMFSVQVEVSSSGVEVTNPTITGSQ